MRSEAKTMLPVAGASPTTYLLEGDSSYWAGAAGKSFGRFLPSGRVYNLSPSELLLLIPFLSLSFSLLIED